MGQRANRDMQLCSGYGNILKWRKTAPPVITTQSIFNIPTHMSCLNA